MWSITQIVTLIYAATGEPPPPITRSSIGEGKPPTLKRNCPLLDNPTFKYSFLQWHVSQRLVWGHLWSMRPHEDHPCISLGASSPFNVNLSKTMCYTYNINVVFNGVYWNLGYHASHYVSQEFLLLSWENYVTLMEPAPPESPVTWRGVKAVPLTPPEPPHIWMTGMEVLLIPLEPTTPFTTCPSHQEGGGWDKLEAVGYI